MKDNSQELAKLLAEAREHIAYKTEGAIIEFTEELCRVMKETGCSKAELAKRLGCKPAFITKLLSGQNNFTIETMVKVAAAVGTEVRMHLQPEGAEAQWMELWSDDATTMVEPAAASNVCAPSSCRNEYSAAAEIAARAGQQKLRENSVSNEELALAA